MKNLLKVFGPFLGLLFVYLLFVWLCPPSFSSIYNVKLIITQTVIIGIAALGMTLVIVSGGIDLSAGSQVALATVVCALLLNAFGGTAFGSIVALLGALAATGVAGLTIGVFSAKLRIVPFIVTLGMMQVARGVAKWAASEQTVPTPSNVLQGFMMVDPEPEWLLVAPGVWVAIVLLILVHIVLTKTVFGRYVVAIGSNEKTARLCGINVTKTRILIYFISSLFIGMAGVFQYSSLSVGDPTAAYGMELDIIAAVVIGGGSLAGGVGSATGTIVGALIMAVLRNGSNMLGLPNYIQEIVIGCIIVAAVALDKLRS